MLLTLAALLISTVVAVHTPASPATSLAAVKGTVTLTDARGEKFDAPGVQLELACRATGDDQRSATSDRHGIFQFADVAPGSCLLTADLQGFGKVTTKLVVRPAEAVDVAVRLDVEAVGSGPRVIAGSTSSWHTKRSN